MQTIRFAMIRDINGYNGFGVQQSNNCTGTTLVETVEQHVTVPADHAYYLAIFYYSAGATVFVSTTGTAVLPNDSFSSSTAIINPPALLVKSNSIISMITPDSSDYVVIAYYALPNYGSANI